LKPQITGRRDAFLEVPAVLEERCTGCRECAELCQFKAITVLGDTVLTFPEMCHGCGGCFQVCPEKALVPDSRLLGDIQWGRSGPAAFLMGRLRVSEAMSPPLMRQVLEQLETGGFDTQADAVFDAPPGVSCPAVAAVIESDVIVLVTEPTPFGAFDLRLAHQAFQPLGKPMGAVVNRAGTGNDEVYRFCREVDLPILEEIPFDRRIAEAYSRGEIIAQTFPELGDRFARLARTLRSMAAQLPEARHA
jgi:MinD superfamily P-loop ATPase